MPKRSKDSAALYPTTFHSSRSELGRIGFFFTGRDLNFRMLFTGKLGSLLREERLRAVLVRFKLVH